MIRPKSLRAESLATRTYWDTFGAESESKSIEQKIIDLGLFVQDGGHISDVVDLYISGRDDESQLDDVQWAVFYYLEYLINARKSLAPYEYAPTAQRIMCLDRDELLELLEKDLRRCTITDYKGLYVLSGLSVNDVNLDEIERRHWREHPEESASSYFRKARRWDRRLPGLWRKEK